MKLYNYTIIGIWVFAFMQVPIYAKDEEDPDHPTDQSHIGPEQEVKLNQHLQERLISDGIGLISSNDELKDILDRANKILIIDGYDDLSYENPTKALARLLEILTKTGDGTTIVLPSIKMNENNIAALLHIALKDLKYRDIKIITIGDLTDIDLLNSGEIKVETLLGNQKIYFDIVHHKSLYDSNSAMYFVEALYDQLLMQERKSIIYALLNNEASATQKISRLLAHIKQNGMVKNPNILQLEVYDSANPSGIVFGNTSAYLAALQNHPELATSAIKTNFYDFNTGKTLASQAIDQLLDKAKAGEAKLILALPQTETSPDGDGVKLTIETILPEGAARPMLRLTVQKPKDSSFGFADIDVDDVPLRELLPHQPLKMTKIAEGLFQYDIPDIGHRFNKMAFDYIDNKGKISTIAIPDMASLAIKHRHLHLNSAVEVLAHALYLEIKALHDSRLVKLFGTDNPMYRLEKALKEPGLVDAKMLLEKGYLNPNINLKKNAGYLEDFFQRKQRYLKLLDSYLLVKKQAAKNLRLPPSGGSCQSEFSF